MVSKTQTEEYLRKTQLPVATKSYTVISHGDIIDAVREILAKHGFIITSELYKAECNGDVALGFMQIETQDDPDMAMTFNWTNSYNKTVRFSCSIGGFIYDNQVPFVSANNQVSWNRKHTGTALEETMEVIEAMVASADEHFAQIVDMKNKFKSIDVSRKEYAKLMGLLYFDKKVISSTQVEVIKKEYDKPSFDYTDKGTLWEVYKMIMFGIVDQAPKNWYRQQLDINSYVQVLFNIASIELENETQATELDLDVVNDDSEEQVLDIQAVQKEVEIIPAVHQEDIIEFITDEQEDVVMEQMFTPVLPCVGHEVESVKDEIKSVDNLIAAQNMVLDAKSVGTTEPSLFADIDSKKERLEEIREELNNESVSYGELVELQGMTEFIEEGDVQLLEAAGVPEFDAEVEVLTTEQLVERYGDQVDLTEFDDTEDLILPEKMSEEQIEMVKEEHAVIEKGNPDDGLIGSIDESPEDLFDMMDEYDEPVDEVPWITEEPTTEKVMVAPSLIPDSMREAVTEIIADKYQNKRTVVNTIEADDHIVFELDSKEFFVVDK